MNYKEMTDKEFMDYINGIVDNKQFDTIKSLSQDDEFMEFLLHTKVNKRFDTSFRYRLTSFYSYLLKFKKILKLYGLNTNYGNCSLEERRELINSIFNNSNNSCIKLFDETFQLEFKELKEYYVKLRVVDLKLDEYTEVKDKCKVILDAFYKNKDLKDACYVIFTHKYFPIKSVVELIKRYYFNSIFKDDSIQVFNDFSFKDIVALDIINNYVGYDFLNLLHSKYVTDKNINFDILRSFYELIHELEKKCNYDYYEIVYLLAHDYNIDLYKLNNELLALNGYYKNKYFDQYSVTDENIEVFKNIFSFYKVIDTYSSLVSKGLELSEIIVGNNPKRERIIEISYYLLFFNRVAPYSNVYRFNNKENLYPTKEGRKKLLEYYKGYEDYYEQNRYIIEEEKQKEKDKQDEIKRNLELMNISKFEKIIMAYIKANGLTILEFCEANNITESEFKYMVDVLEKNESEVFKAYEEYNESNKSQRFAIIMSKLRKMLKNLVEGKGNYTLLDYYTDTSFPIEEAYKLLKTSMTPEQRRQFMIFKNKYNNDTVYGVKGIEEFINNYNVKYGIEVDSNGNFITSYEVTKEDKQQVIIMLKERNIPITRTTCNLMLRKYYQEFILPNYKNNQLKID